MLDFREPIFGLEAQPLVSLAEAAVGVLKADTVIMAYTVAQSRIEGNENLSLDEIAAALLYTSEWGGDIVYQKLNQVLWSINRKKIAPWLPFLKLLMSAFSKLPRSDWKAVHWRDIEDDVEEAYSQRIGKEVVWWGVSSMSLDLKQVFCVPQKQPGALFIVRGSGICLRGVSCMAHEDEVVLPPGSIVRVVSVTRNGKIGSLIEVELVQAAGALGRGLSGPWETADSFRRPLRARIVDDIERKRDAAEAYAELGEELGWFDRVWLHDGREIGKVEAFLEASKCDVTHWRAFRGLSNVLTQDEVARVLCSLHEEILDKIDRDPNNSIAFYVMSLSVGDSDEVNLRDGRKMSKQALLVEAVSHNSKLAAAYNDLGKLLKESEIVLKDGRRMSQRGLFLEAVLCGNHAVSHLNLAAALKEGEQISLEDGRIMSAGMLTRESVRIRFTNWGM